MRTRKTAHYPGPRAKRPSHGTANRSPKPDSEIRFGQRTPQGDTYEITPTDQLLDSKQVEFDKAASAERCRAMVAGQGTLDMPDHW